MIQDTQAFVQLMGYPSIRILRVTARYGIVTGVEIYQEHCDVTRLQAIEDLNPFMYYNSAEMEEDLREIQDDFPELFL